jgi:hypothetical protein
MTSQITLRILLLPKFKEQAGTAVSLSQESILTKLSILQAVLAIALLFAVALPSNAVADALTTQTDVKRACLSKTTDDPTYMKAVERANALPIVLDWEKSLGSQSRMALGVRDNTEFIEGRCYWSVSFYRSDSSHMLLWKIFRVGITTSDIFMMNHFGKFLPVDSH